jgi:hypothetical protein
MNLTTIIDSIIVIAFITTLLAVVGFIVYAGYALVFLDIITAISSIGFGCVCFILNIAIGSQYNE